MKSQIELEIDNCYNVFSLTQEFLNDWVSDKNIQFSKILEFVCVKLSITDALRIKESDNLIRMFVRKHPDWHIIKGNKGGIMRMSKFKDKLAAKVEQNKLKEEINYYFKID